MALSKEVAQVFIKKFKSMDLKNKFLAITMTLKDDYVLSSKDVENIMKILKDTNSGCLGIIHLPVETKVVPTERLEVIIKELQELHAYQVREEQ